MAEQYGKDAGDIQARQAEEAMFEQVAAEMAARDIKKGLWAKALALSDGSAERAKALYIKLRVQALRDEAALKAAQERPQPRPVEMPERQPVRREAAAAARGDWQDYGAPERAAPVVEKQRAAASSLKPAKVQHADQSKTFLGGDTHPWRRYFARFVDTLIILVLFVALVFGAAKGMPEHSVGVLVAIANLPEIAIGIGLLLLWVPIEAVFLATFGATPAKALFGIKVVHADGSLLTFAQALERSFRVFVQGNGLGFPLFTLFTNLFAYQRLTKTGTTLWDTATDAEVRHAEWGAVRMLACIAAVVVSIAAFRILSSDSTYGDAPQAASTGTQQQPRQSQQSMAPTPATNRQSVAPANIDAPVDEHGNTPLMIAARDGDVEGVKHLLAVGANVNAANNYGVTALMRSAGKGNEEIVSILINAGASVNAVQKSGVTVLMDAAISGHTETVRRLIKAGANVNAARSVIITGVLLTQHGGVTALMDAASNGHTEVARLLINAGADVNAKHVWRNPSGYIQVDTALKKAYFFVKNPEKVKEHIDAGIPTSYGHAEIVQILLDAGAQE